MSDLRPVMVELAGGVVELLDPATYVRRVEAGEIDPSPGVEAREAMERYATRPGGHA